MARYNKQSLVDELLLHDIFADVSKAKTTQFVEDLLQMIQDHVVAGDEVTFGGFGKFEKYTRQNGTVKPKFTAFKDFKDAVAG